MQTLFIAGGSASGKSTLAGLIVDALRRRGKSATIVRQDSFYNDRPDSESGADRHLYDFDQPYSIDWDTFERALESLSEGEPADVPLYDFSVSKRAGMSVLHPEGDVLIVDGTLVLHAERLHPFMDRAVYVRCPEPLRRERRHRRDTVERGRHPDDIDRQLDTQVFPAHNSYVAPSARRADLVLEAEAIMANPDAAVDAVLDVLSA